MFDLQNENEVNLRENEFFKIEYSRASLLIQTLVNTYTRDSHIMAYKVKVNAEILSLEKQLKGSGIDDSNRKEMEKYLGILKRSNTYTSGLRISLCNIIKNLSR